MIPAIPLPASFENSPRATPCLNASVIVCPASPPTIASGLNAPTKN